MNKQVAFFLMLLLIAASACTAVENPGVDQEPVANQSPSSDIEQAPPETEPEVIEPATEEEQSPTPTTALIQEPLEMIFLDDGGEMNSPGPWMVYNTSFGMVVVSGDGSEIVSLGFPLDDRIVSWAAPKNGGVLALVKESFDSLPGAGGKWLEIRTLPRNELVFTLELMDYSGVPLSFSEEREEEDFIADRHRAVGQVVWSHDGQTLAFVSSHEGPSPDVYTYNLNSGDVIQLTSGPSHAVDLAWSPDDAYIFHAGVEKMWTEYSGAGYSGWTFYAARPDGSEVVQVYEGTKEIQQEFIIGWYSDSEVLQASGYWWCGLFDFRMVAIESGEQTTIMKGQHNYSAYGPASKKALVWIDPDQVDYEECGPTGEGGLFLVSVPGGMVEKLESYPTEIEITGIEWEETEGVFLADGGESWLVVDPEGRVLELPQRPFYSPDGKWVAYVDNDGDYFTIFDVENDVSVEIEHKGKILYPIWSPDSSHLFYFQEREKENYFDLYLMEIPGLQSTLLAENVFYKYNQKPIWLMP